MLFPKRAVGVAVGLLQLLQHGVQPGPACWL
jgi:hypothetical protein